MLENRDQLLILDLNNLFQNDLFKYLQCLLSRFPHPLAGEGQGEGLLINTNTTNSYPPLT